jgi:hypothetical protein
VSLGGLIYLISNHLTELNEDGGADDSGFGLRARFVDWVNQLPLDDVKNQSLSITQKLLHRIRILLLKTDNYLMKIIGKISERDRAINENGNDKENMPDFWDNLSNNKQEPILTSEKFIDPVRNGSKKIDGILAGKVSNGVDIQPINKTPRTKKSQK